jgi:hypothetical protein
MNLIDVTKSFATEDQCQEFLAQGRKAVMARWAKRMGENSAYRPGAILDKCN